MQAVTITIIIIIIIISHLKICLLKVANDVTPSFLKCSLLALRTRSEAFTEICATLPSIVYSLTWQLSQMRITSSWKYLADKGQNVI